MTEKRNLYQQYHYYKQEIDNPIDSGAPSPEERLDRLSVLYKKEQHEGTGHQGTEQQDHYVNNHIHTTYSFSPYSPSMAIWMAHKAGLHIAGIADHDSVSGAHEFACAGKITGVATTIGVECRVDFSGTLLEGRSINNPDQDTIAYIVIHGIPAAHIGRIHDFFAPYREERNKRNRLMTAGLNRIISQHGLSIDFDRDIVPLSCSEEGGSVTERHILFALVHKLTQTFSRGKPVIDFLEHELKLAISPKNRVFLEDNENWFYHFDMLNVLKSSLVEQFYIDAKAECPPVRDILKLSEECGAISAYSYLGDVTDSVTGDKQAQLFEDSYLDMLFSVIKELGFRAVTYMPTRNTPHQLERLNDLCIANNFFRICGEDINSPRQSFVCEKLKSAKFRLLVDSAWALIGHEYMSGTNPERGLFSAWACSTYPDIMERISIYREAGKQAVKTDV